MNSVANNSTAICCLICREDYKKDEAEDVREVIELQCDHLFHIACLKPMDRPIDLPHISRKEAFHHSRTKPRRCAYCNQPSGYFRLAKGEFDVRRVLPLYLEDLEKEYEHDQKVLNTVLLIREKRDILEWDIDNSRSFFLTVFKVLTGLKSLGALRTIEEEAERWKKVTSFDQYPLALRERGVFVITDAGDFRVSVRYLDRAIRQIRKEEEDKPTPLQLGLEEREKTVRDLKDILPKYFGI